jgi:hypothetical protein
MIPAFHKFLAIALFTVIFHTTVQAQPRTGEFINVAMGIGASGPSDETDVTGAGFYAQGEYVLGLASWFGVRPYAGVIFTSAEKNDNHPNEPDYKVTSNAFLIGAKVRVLAPIPYVAPYIEIGLGASIGSFVTYTPETNVKSSGVLMHIPFSFGLSVGKKHAVDIAFTYYFHPSVDQFSGAGAVGFTFPLQ